MERAAFQHQLAAGQFDQYAQQKKQREEEAAYQAYKFQQDQQAKESEEEIQGSAYTTEFYDPQDPNADWSGFVAKPQGRLHMSDKNTHVTSIKPNVKYNAFVPSSNAETSDWVKPGKKAIAPGGGQRTDMQNVNPNTQNTYRSESFALFGGPTEQRTSGRFETEAQAAMKGGNGGTLIEQLTPAGRSMYVRGKKNSEIMYENAPAYDPNLHHKVEMNPYNLTGGAYNPNNSSAAPQQPKYLDNGEENLIGYRQHQGGGAAYNSLSTGIGSSVLSALGAPPSKPSSGKRYVGAPLPSPAPFATDANLKTDPYAAPGGGRSKDLFRENYQAGNGIPGYTGKRR